MELYNETIFEHAPGSDYYGVTTGERTVKNRLAKLAEQHPTECVCMARNEEDGSVFYHVPVKWVTIRPPRIVELTEERRAELAERMRKIRKTQ